METIDRSKCGTEYFCCSRCKWESPQYYVDYCWRCTRVVDVGYAFILRGIPVGSGLTHYHKNFTPKDTNKKEIHKNEQ